jgi:hypothetical protein
MSTTRAPSELLLLRGNQTFRRFISVSDNDENFRKACAAHQFAVFRSKVLKAVPQEVLRQLRLARFFIKTTISFQLVWARFANCQVYFRHEEAKYTARLTY